MTRNRFFALALVVLSVSGCDTIGFYGQAISGQLSVLSHRQNIEKLLASDATDADLKKRLALVQEIRRFSEQELGLPVGKSYSSYVDLGRSADDNFVVWNVFAAPELSLDAHNWCYPLIGCAAYRGYFSRERAEQYAGRMQHQGLDTYVGGVKAYSTLGWFADPVLSTFVQFDEARLAALLFHELAHKIVYIRDDTEFNESFATAVEREGLRRWLRSHGEQNVLSRMEAQRKARAEVFAQVATLRTELEALYSDAELTELDKIEQKKLLFSQFSASMLRLHPSDSFQQWVQRIKNNASLVPIRSYNRWLEAFTQLLVQNDRQLSRFFLAVKELGDLPGTEREQQLQKLTDTYAGSVQELKHE